MLDGKEEKLWNNMDVVATLYIGRKYESEGHVLVALSIRYCAHFVCGIARTCNMMKHTI